MNDTVKNVVSVTRDYYDSKDADEFYFRVWGGEDIHIGIYENGLNAISAASRKTVDLMIDRLGSIDQQTRIIDLGSGYGGSARVLAEKFKCHVTCLNLSQTQNVRNQELTREHGLEDYITVIEGDFEDIQQPNNNFDMVWSQDSILHSGQKSKVFAEVFRILERQGIFMFTDPMQTENCPQDKLKHVLDRINLKNMGSVHYYQELGEAAGFEVLPFLDLSEHLIKHYTSVLEDLQKRYQEIVSFCSATYLDNMITGLNHWIDAGHAGYLQWGILHMIKR